MTIVRRENKGVVTSHELYTISEWLGLVKDRYFIDYDGYGECGILQNDGTVLIPESHEPAYPSRAHRVPFHITHIIWYNR